MPSGFHSAKHAQRASSLVAPCPQGGGPRSRAASARRAPVRALLSGLNSASSEEAYGLAEWKPLGGVHTSNVIGLSGEVSRVVTPGLTARAVGSGDLDVFATPMLVALLEAAACAALEGQLPEGSTSVGTHVDVRHRAPSAVGTTVTAEATVTAVDGARIEFEVSAWQEADGKRTTVATGRHTRVIVDRATFLS